MKTIATQVGKRTMPATRVTSAPIRLALHFSSDDATEALPPERTPPRSSSDGESAEFLRRASVVGGPEMDSVSSIAGILWL